MLDTALYNARNSMGVPLKRSRFPLEEGVQAKVTLISNLDGLFKNIAFVSGSENTINGSIADDLLDMYPEIFTVTKVNGLPYGMKDKSEANAIAKDVIERLKEDFDLIPKKKDNSRARVEEAKLLAEKEVKEEPKEEIKPDTKSKYQKVN